MRSIYGDGLVSRGLVSITQSQWIDQYDINGLTKLCEKNDSNIWALLTNPGGYLLIDLKKQYPISGILFMSSTYLAYPWSKHPPSYSLQFSNDNNVFQTLFEERKSTRINYENISTEISFNRTYKYRYFRIMMLDFSDNSKEHGQYISWLDFYTSHVRNISCQCFKYQSNYLSYIFIILFDN